MRLPPSVRIDGVGPVKAAGLAAIAEGDRTFDLSALVDADSSLVALLLAWQRAARRAGGEPVRYVGAHAGVVSLATLYGVAPLVFPESATPR